MNFYSFNSLYQQDNQSHQIMKHQNVHHKMSKINHKKNNIFHSVPYNYPISNDLGPNIPIQNSIYYQNEKGTKLIQPDALKSIRQNLQKQYKLYRAILQYHSLRSLKFNNQRQRILQKNEITNQIKNNTLQIKQQKALLNKKLSIIVRRKNIEKQRSKWQQSINKKRKQHLEELNHSTRLVTSKEPIIRSISRKSLKDQEIYPQNRQKFEIIDEKMIKNNYSPYNQRKNHQIIHQLNSLHHHHQTLKRSSTILHNRVSTEEVLKRHNKISEQQLQKSLFKTVQKQKRIKQARAVKIYLNNQRSKRQSQRIVLYQKSQKQKINQIKEKIEQRNRILNCKFKQNRRQMLDTSLPTIINHKTSKKSNLSNEENKDIVYQPTFHKYLVNKIKKHIDFIKQQQ